MSTELREIYKENDSGEAALSIIHQQGKMQRVI